MKLKLRIKRTVNGGIIYRWNEYSAKVEGRAYITIVVLRFPQTPNRSNSQSHLLWIQKIPKWRSRRLSPFFTVVTYVSQTTAPCFCSARDLNSKRERHIVTRHGEESLHSYIDAEGCRVVGRVHCAREQWRGSFFRWRTLSTVPPLATANWRSACATRT